MAWQLHVCKHTLLAMAVVLVLAGPAWADLKIMPLGDSNTGIDPDEFADPDIGPAFENMSKYRKNLYSLLTYDGYTANFVGTEQTGENSPPSPLADLDHEGHGGYRIRQLTLGVNEDGAGGIGDWLDELEAAGQLPDIVLLMAGTNDMLQGQAYRNAAPANLASLIDTLTDRLPLARIVVASIPPLYIPNQPQYDGYVDTFNSKIWNTDPGNLGIVNVRMAAGKRVSFVDINSVLGPSDMASDGKHMNATGYDKAGQQFYYAVVPEPGTVGLLLLGLPAVLARRRRVSRPLYSSR